jgi:uncharacterized Zn finger protein (UPF0148 family)
MPKYVIEENLSFYDELYKSLDEPETQEETTEMCLITNAPLKENFVTLGCNHKFNYDAIYNDIYCHKKKYNSMERCALKHKEIRCPYCRTIHKELLPYVDGYQKVHGVNHYDEMQDKSDYTYHSEFKPGVCAYVLPTSNAIENSVVPSQKCPNCYVKMFQIDNKTYCSIHYTTRTREVYRANKIKEQMEKKKAVMLEKQKIKDEKIKAKLEEKLKKQAEKLKQKAEKMNAKANKMKNENVIISSYEQPIEIDETKCTQILKSGSNKGKQCGCKIVNQGLCGRHNKTKEPQEQLNH